MSHVFAHRDLMMPYREKAPEDISQLYGIVSKLLFERVVTTLSDNDARKLYPGEEGIVLTDKKMPDTGILPFYFPEKPQLNFCFQFSSGGLKIAVLKDTVQDAISSTWSGFFDFLCNERSTDLLFMDGDWWVADKKPNMFDMSGIGRLVQALEQLIPVFHSASDSLRDELDKLTRPYREMESIECQDKQLSDLAFHRDYRSQGKPLLFTKSMHYWGIKEFSVETLFEWYQGKYQNVNVAGMSLGFPLDDYFARISNRLPVPFKAKIPLIKEVRKEFVYPSYFPEESYFKKSQGIIIGSQNSEGKAGYNNATRWHRDFADNMFMHLAGKKRVWLAPPCEAECFYVTVSDACHSNVEFDCSPLNPAKPDLNQYPKFSEAKKVSCVMEAGDTLFIPRGWFHNIENLSDISCSINNWAFN